MRQMEQQHLPPLHSTHWRPRRGGRELSPLRRQQQQQQPHRPLHWQQQWEQERAER